MARGHGEARRGLAALLLGMAWWAGRMGGERPAFADAVTIDFSDKTLASNSFYNGGPASNANGWSSGGVRFGNGFNATWESWNGFAYSNVNDATTAAWTNQYAAITGTGFGGAGVYAVAYSGPQDFIDLPTNHRPASVRVTNTTYAYFDMLNGSGFSKKFGGVSGDDPDWFFVRFTGYAAPGATGAQTGTVVDFYLADYRFTDNSQDYLVSTWQQVDLTPLGEAASIGLSWSSSDVGGWGMNTPAYAALDNLVLTVPEPSVTTIACGGAVVWLAVRRRGRRS